MAWFAEDRRSPSMTQEPTLALLTVASPSLQDESDALLATDIA